MNSLKIYIIYILMTNKLFIGEKKEQSKQKERAGIKTIKMKEINK